MFDGRYLDWNQKRIKGIIDYYSYPFIYGKKVLDLGCGHGDVGGALYRLGADVIALDARQEHLNIINKKFTGIKTVKSDLDSKWSFNELQFDIILDLDVLNHLNDYEKHLRTICKSTTHLVIEAAVCDSIDPYKVFHITENKNQYDMAINGQGCRPSAGAIERILNESGFTFKRYDNSKFNSGDYIYDWQSSNDNSHDINHRRIWFAIKENKPISSNITQLNTNNFKQLTQIPSDNLKLNSKNVINTNSPEPIKTALCISGHLRTFLDNYNSVKVNILDKLNCDVFIHTWDTLGLSYRHTDSNLHITETKHVTDTINKLYKPKKIIIEKSRYFSITPLMQQRLIDHRDVSGILSMWYKIEACNNLKKDYEIENNFKYDCVIRFRGDLFVEQPIPIDIHTNLQHLFLPNYGNFGGACDQFAYGNSEIMDKYSELYSNLENHLTAGAPLHPERMMLFHLEKQNLPIAKVNFKYLIKRANGLIQDNMLLERALGFK